MVLVVTGLDQAEPLETKAESDLMAQVVGRENMRKAYVRVLRNAGSAGVDNLTVSELGDHLRAHWSSIKSKLLAGQYQPQPVRRVMIAKPNGGERQLGIPTVLDRLIQQALHQVLSPLFEETFSDHSYGFRPGRSAHQAVQRAEVYVKSGFKWVVDVDLENFFDQVNHDILMSRIERKIEDKRILKLIRKYLKVGVMVDGAVSPRSEGTPQGGPLSPLLSNILLTDLDRELEQRGHCFVRYADDVMLYVKSERAGQRVLSNLKRFIETRLKLRVNEHKSAVAPSSKRPYLGYLISARGLWVSRQSVTRLVTKIRQVLSGARGRSLRSSIEELNPILRGWAAYFKFATNKSSLDRLDGWVRRRLRCILWRHWKRPRTRERALRALGLSAERAWRSSVNGRGPWWNAGASHMNQAVSISRFASWGLVSVLATVGRLQRVS